jgi:hypothetical protein
VHNDRRDIAAGSVDAGWVIRGRFGAAELPAPSARGSTRGGWLLIFENPFPPKSSPSMQSKITQKGQKAPLDTKKMKNRETGQKSLKKDFREKITARDAEAKKITQEKRKKATDFFKKCSEDAAKILAENLDRNSVTNRHKYRNKIRMWREMQRSLQSRDVKSFLTRKDWLRWAIGQNFLGGLDRCQPGGAAEGWARWAKRGRIHTFWQRNFAQNPDSSFLQKTLWTEWEGRRSCDHSSSRNLHGIYRWKQDSHPKKICFIHSFSTKEILPKTLTPHFYTNHFLQNGEDESSVTYCRAENYAEFT